jgi:hypothetical protein
VRSNICYTNQNSQLKAEVKEIRAALGDDGRRSHKELIQLATKAAEWRTWKEKYIDLRNAHIAEGQDPAGTIWEHADKLQKQVAASQAENAKLRELVEQAADWLDYMGRSQSSATLREALNPQPPTPNSQLPTPNS